MLLRNLKFICLLLAFALPLRAAVTIQTQSPLYNGSVSDTYNLQFSATGGTPPYTWSISSGTPPAGLALNALNTPGLLSGTPTATGTASFSVQVADSSGEKAQQSFQLSVLAADNRYCNAGNVVNFAGATTDGPAVLPQSCYFTLRSATPSPGATCAAHTASDLYDVLNATLNCSDGKPLACGDTIQLDAGSSYATTGNTAFKFPALGCSNSQYITVESTGVSSNLWPAEDVRISPCFADVASLPGRPPFNCPGGKPAALMAQILFTGTTGSSGPIDLATNNADHYRFIGVEITRQTAPKTTIENLVALGTGNNVILDQVWCHGVEPAGGAFPASKTNFTETTRCLGLGQSHQVAVINSYLNDFYCTQTNGSGCDAQALAGGIGSALNSGWGTYKIVNNFMEGAAETIEVGGGAGPNTTSVDSPSDWEVRRNHMFKPTSWMPTAKSDAGWPVVKNHFELKNGLRMLVEGNVFQNVWAGFTQTGAMLLLTPKNANLGTENLCPSCAVTDITLRYNYGTQASQAFKIANNVNTNKAFPVEGNDYSMHDNVIDNLGYQPCYSCGAKADPGAIYEDPTVPVKYALHDVSLNHNTFVQALVSQNSQGALLDIAGALAKAGNGMFNITFINNLGEAGTSGTLNAGSAITTNCADKQKGGTAMIEVCWTPFVFGGDAIVANKATWPVMPASNTPNCLSVANFTDIFVSYNGGSGGDYHLLTTSPCHSGATDGTDPGANIDLEASYTASVE